MRKTVLLHLVTNLIIYLAIVLIFFIAFPQEAGVVRYFYLAVISISVLFAWIAQAEKSEKIGRYFWWLSCLILVLVLGLRDKSGMDDFSYHQLFTWAVDMDYATYIDVSGIEIGYKTIVYIIAKLTDNYYICQFLFSFIPIFLFYKAFWHHREMIDLALSVLLLISFYYFQMLSVSLVRMFISLSIVFYSLKYIISKESKKYALCILLAGVIHLSALFMLLFLFLTFNMKNFWKSHWKVFLIVIMIAVPTASYLISQNLVPILSSRYRIYGTMNEFAVNIASFDKLFLIVVAFWYQNKLLARMREYLNLGIILVTVSVLFSVFDFVGNLGRMQYYGNLGAFMILPLIYRNLNYRRWSSILINNGTVAYAFLYLWVTQFSLESHYVRMVPYVSFIKF